MKFRRLSLVLLIASLAGAGPGMGWPLAGEVRVIEGLRCFPDHRDRELWWFLPQRLELVDVSSRPGFSFHRYRYKGSAATGDANEFWARGVLGFSVEFRTDPEVVSGAKAALEQRERHRVRMEPLPIERVESVLVYAGADSETSGSLASGEWKSDEGSWQRRSYTLGLEPRTSELLWEAFHADGLVLGLSYTLSGRTLDSRPPSASSDDQEAEPDERVLSGDSLAVRVSPKECPECFRTFDLDAQVPADYPFLEVYCHDFESSDVPSDLELVVVQVKATAVNGDRPVEQVEFVAGDGASKASVKFRFAVELGEGYEYQVTRESSFSSESEPWRKVELWTGSLDVTRYRGTASQITDLDPRMLY